MAKDIAGVTNKELVLGFRRKQRAITAHPDDNGAQRREQIGQLSQRRVHDRAVFVDLDTDQMGHPVHKGLCIEGCGGRKPLQGRIRHLFLRRDYNVDRHVIATIKIGIDCRQIGLAAQPRDLAVDAKDRMGHLTGDHVHLVRMGGGNDHLGIAGTGAVQHVGVACKAGDPLHIQRIGGAAHQIGVAVNDCDVVAFARKMAGNLPPDLPCAANDHFHKWGSFGVKPCLASPAGACPRDP